MKKIILPLAAALIVACSSDTEEPVMNQEPTEVTLTFSPYEVSAITRTATGISTYCTHLDVWVTDGETTTSAHQTSTDTGFGTVSMSLNRTKTYTLIAVAHKCASNATLTDGIIAFPDEKVTHSMIYKTTFSPATTTSLSCEMTRIVGWFRIEGTDQVPTDAHTIQIAMGDTFTRWNTATSAGANTIDRTATFENFNRNQDGTMTFNLYIIPTNLTDTDHMDITVTALKENGEELEQKTFTDVPVKAGYKTTYRGQFYTTEGMSMSFTADEWSEFDVLEY